MAASEPASAVALAAEPAVQTVVVTATRFADEARRLPFGVSVISAQDLQRSGARTVNEALMRLLGIAARQDLSGGGEYVLDLRGFGATAGANQVVVVDGLRISEGDGGSARLTGLPIDSIERIEVLRGSGAVLYGEGATAGVIHIVTKAGQGRNRPNGGQVQLALGSQNQRELRGSGHLSLGQLSVEAAAQRRLSDGHRDNFRSQATATALAAQWRDERFSLALRHGEDWLHSGLPGYLSADEAAQDPQQTHTPDDWGRLHHERTTLQGRATLGDWTLAADAGWRNKALRSAYYFGGVASPYAYDIDGQESALRAQHALWLAAGLQHSLSLGVEHEKWLREVAGSYGSRADQGRHALLAREVLQLPSGTELSAGVRRERSVKKLASSAAALRQDAAHNSWEIGLLQTLGAGWRVYGRIGDSWRLPNADEFSYTEPGAQLRAQTSRDAELGARWAGRASRAELRIWRSALRHEIGYDPAANGGWGANVNFDPTERRGVEAEGQHALNAALTLRGTLAWRQARFTEGAYDGKTVPLVAPRSASAGVHWRIGAGHALDASARHQAAQHPDYENACRIAGHTVLDARWSWTLPQLELSLAVANLTDRRYTTQAYSCNAGVTGAIYPEPGRSVQAAAQFSF